METDPTEPPDTVRVPISVLTALRDIAVSVAAIETALNQHVAEEKPAMDLARQFAARALESATEMATAAAGQTLSRETIRKETERQTAEDKKAFYARLKSFGYVAGVIVLAILSYLAGNVSPPQPQQPPPTEIPDGP